MHSLEPPSWLYPVFARSLTVLKVRTRKLIFEMKWTKLCSYYRQNAPSLVSRSRPAVGLKLWGPTKYILLDRKDQTLL